MMVRGICVWNAMSMGTCSSRLNIAVWDLGKCQSDAFILCQGMDHVPHCASHVIQGHFGIHEESDQLSVIMKLVIVHHFMHLLPSNIGL